MLQTKNPRHIAIFYLCIIGGFIIGLIMFISYWNNEYAKYPMLKYEDAIKNEIRRTRCEHGTALIDFSDKKRQSLGFARNFKYKPHDLCSFLRAKDSIMKKENNDTVIVRRKDLEYIFVIDEELNKHLDKN